MVTDIIDGISNRLYEAFGDSYTIYSEAIKQGFREPCFFILTLNPSQAPMAGPRYRREYPVDVHYFPPRKFDQNADMLAVADRLYEALEYINVDGDLVRGVDMHYEIVDDVLHFFVSFKIFIIRQEDKERMSDLERRVGTKG